MGSTDIDASHPNQTISHKPPKQKQIQEPLAPLYRRWAAGDDRMRQVAERIPGVRVVRYGKKCVSDWLIGWVGGVWGVDGIDVHVCTRIYAYGCTPWMHPPVIRPDTPNTKTHICTHIINRQDPTECLFSFICSSNNNIPRITLMLDRLRATYGEPLVRSRVHHGVN